MSVLNLRCFGKLRKQWVFLLVVVAILLLFFFILSDDSHSDISVLSKNALMEWRFRWNDVKEDNVPSVSIADLVILTAFSANHENEFLKLCEHLSAYKELHVVPYRFVVYSLRSPFSLPQLIGYRKKCPSHTEFRDFPFARYPHYVEQLTEFRWKHLLIRDLLEESPLVLYGDSSLRLTNQRNQSLTAIVEALKNPQSANVFLFNESGHSILRATNPEMYKFFSYPRKMAQNTSMFDASPSMWLRTKKMRKSLDQIVDCSLRRECMAPKGSRVHCDFKNFPEHWMYANCHRFDQSAVNIVLSMNSGGDSAKYKYPAQNVLRTVRGG